MYHKNRKEEAPKPRRWDSFGDDWIDSNEQELEKSGFFAETERYRRTVNEETRIVPKASDAELPCEGTEKRLLGKEATKNQQSNNPKDTSEEPQKKLKEAPKAEQPTTHQSKRQSGLAWFFLLLTLVFLSALTVLGVAIFSKAKYATGENQPIVTETPTWSEQGEGGEKIVFVRPYDDGSGLLTTPELYEKCAKSVVSILGEKEGASGVGSGFFITEDGYVATVAHVVEAMDRVTVITADGTKYPAEVVSSNALTDLALLKIEGSRFPTVSFGASKELLTGEKVVAIGTPASLDYAGSVSSGEISYLSRTVKIYDATGQVLQKKMTLLQTNAPVNPGNSGCPLFDEYGRVVGVVTMKLGSNYAGIGFAIPSDGALPILQAMMKGSPLSDALLSAVSVTAPKLGILGEKGQVDGIAGVLVKGFSEKQSHAASILRIGDLIIQIEGAPVGSSDDIIDAICDKQPGDSVRIMVLRSGQKLTFEVNLEKS